MAGSLVAIGVGIFFLFDALGSFGKAPHKSVFIRGLLGLGLLSAAGTGAKVWVPTLKLNEGLASLRPVKGKTRRAVFAALGKPNVTERDTDGQVTLAIWRTPRRSVSLAFEDGVCAGIVREADADAPPTF